MGRPDERGCSVRNVGVREIRLQEVMSVRNYRMRSFLLPDVNLQDGRQFTGGPSVEIVHSEILRPDLVDTNIARTYIPADRNAGQSLSAGGVFSTLNILHIYMMNTDILLMDVSHTNIL